MNTLGLLGKYYLMTVAGRLPLPRTPAESLAKHVNSASIHVDFIKDARQTLKDFMWCRVGRRQKLPRGIHVQKDVSACVELFNYKGSLSISVGSRYWGTSRIALRRLVRKILLGSTG